MYNKTYDAAGVEELVIKNGNGNGEVYSEPDTQLIGRVALAEGMKQLSPELLERYESVLDAYATKIKQNMDRNAKKAQESAKSDLQTEAGEVHTVNPFGPYKWWDLFLIGPFQSIPSVARPNKIIAGNETVSFIAAVATNPLPIDGFNPPSAQVVMAGRRYRFRLETFNLTNGTVGPLVSITSAFPGSSSLQVFGLSMIVPTPLQGRPELFEVNLTADVLDAFQPMAAFATTILDVDRDPGFPIGSPSAPHLKIEQPLRCLCYRK